MVLLGLYSCILLYTDCLLAELSVSLCSLLRFDELAITGDLAEINYVTPTVFAACCIMAFLDLIWLPVGADGRLYAIVSWSLPVAVVFFEELMPPAWFDCAGAILYGLLFPSEPRPISSECLRPPFVLLLFFKS